MNVIDPQLISQAASADLDTLCVLDKHGLLIGQGENTADYAARLEALAGNIERMETSLLENGTFSVEGITVNADNRIPSPLFADARDMTRRLFGFSIDWVPGFFITPPGMFFGGCAFYFFPDFFALFIIRESFRDKEKWLIYSRPELLAHELCHVARIGLVSRIYEEVFAYQTANSPFRRFTGAIFRSPGDTFLFLGSTLLLLICQLAKTIFLPALWIWPFWGVVIAASLFLSIRLAHNSRCFHRALKTLGHVTKENALKILYRCADDEITELANIRDPKDAETWIAARDDLRWAVIRQRFLTPETDSPMPVSPKDEPIVPTAH